MQSLLQLRIVRTQAILFLKSMSERGGSDIVRHSTIVLESVWKFIIKFQRGYMSDPSLSDIDFNNKMA